MEYDNTEISLIKGDETYTFTRAQQNAIELLGAGASNVEAAKAVGVKESTIRRWLKGVPGFLETVEMTKAALPALKHDELLKKVPALEKRAVDVVAELMEQNDNLKVKLEAARMALQLTGMINNNENSKVTVSFGAMPEPGLPHEVIHREG